MKSFLAGMLIWTIMYFIFVLVLEFDGWAFFFGYIVGAVTLTIVLLIDD